jgi:hypothetical protein
MLRENVIVAVFGDARPDCCGKCAGQRTHSHCDGCGRMGTDHIRSRCRSTDRWPGDRPAARTWKMTMVYDTVRSRDGDIVPLRLIERTTAFSSRNAMTVIARPTSQRSSRRVKGPLWIVVVEALSTVRISLPEELRSATNRLVRVEQLTLPYAGRNIHHRLSP